MESFLRYKLLSRNASPPFKSNPLSVGFDLKAAEIGVIKARKSLKVKTDLCLQFPNVYYGRITARSGLATTFGIVTTASTIGKFGQSNHSLKLVYSDPDYTGNVYMCLFNLSDTDFHFNIGDRLAQLIVQPYANPPMMQVEQLKETERGDKAFGSSGLNENK